MNPSIPPHNPLLSIVTPAFNEAGNLSVFYQRLADSLTKINIKWEWIVVDDHSSDGTFQILQNLARRDARIVAIRLARNLGSHLAIQCGLKHAHGDAIAIMASDLQDPPELLKRLIEPWQDGFPVVWAAREYKQNEYYFKGRFFSQLYYIALRTITGLTGIPQEGADFLLMDQTVLRKLLQFTNPPKDLFTAIHKMKFRHTTIKYGKQERLHGKSGWTLQKKMRLFFDSMLGTNHQQQIIIEQTFPPISNSLNGINRIK